MAKPILRFKVNKQSAEVGGKYYGIVEDSAVTPENSILQICEFKKITAFAPEQVLRLVEDVCDGAAQLVARDGQSRQLSSLLKFSPRVRGTFSSEDARWTDQKLIVGARLLKDIKLNMDPSSFVMSNVADVGILTSAAWQTCPWGSVAPTVGTTFANGTCLLNINGSKLDSWGADNTTAKLAVVIGSDVYFADEASGPAELSDFAANGFNFSFVLSTEGGNTISNAFNIPLSVVAATPIDGFVVVIYHPDSTIEFKRLSLPSAKPA